MKKRSLIICLVMALGVLSFCPVNTQAKTVKKGGTYETTAVRKAKFTSVVLKKYKVRGRKLITYGKFYYMNSSGTFKTLKAKKRVFKISSSCVYKVSNGLNPRRSTRKTVFKKLKRAMKKNAGDGLTIKVRNGKAVLIQYGQI